MFCLDGTFERGETGERSKMIKRRCFTIKGAKMTTSENKRNKTTVDAATNKVSPFVWIFEECKRVVRFLLDCVYWWI